MIIHQNKKEFLDMCYQLIDSQEEESNVIILGEKFKGKSYEDELISICSSKDKSFFEVIRQNNQFPIIWIRNYEIINFQSEFIYLLDHVKRLLQKNNHNNENILYLKQ